MKRQTARQKRLDWSDALKCLKRGQPPERLNSRRRDGSIPVKPVRASSQPERDVLAECLSLLRSRKILADRLNNGKFCSNGRWAVYGIIGGGDIVAVLPGGIHVEVECKAGRGGLLSVEQQRRQERVTSHGGKYVVVCSVDELRDWLDKEVRGDEADNGIFSG